MKELLSDNGRFVAIQQDDGNFVVYEHPNNKVAWSMFSEIGNRNEDNEDIPNNPPSNPNPNPNPPDFNPSLFATIEDNVNPIGMAYWRNINNHRDRNEMYIFLSVDDELILYTVSKSNLAVIGKKSLLIHHTGEGCYFSARDYNILYVTINNTLNRINVETGDRETVWQSDYNLWQCHTSYDDKTHSASLKDSNWDIKYWGVYKNGNQKKYDLHAEPDECQIDMSGKYLTAKETNNEKLQNRIITLSTNEDRTITNEQGSLGHSDCGFGCMIGENAKSQVPGALDYINLETLHRALMYSTGIWNMGYVSFTNARDWQIEKQKCLVSTPSELISVNLDGSGQGRVVCNNLTQSQEYEDRPKANLCPNGEFAIWTAKVDGRMSAYLVRV